ncbi:GDP/UDP-N,N'-diacetylbacillosamine 2-epimerase (hydrolysing) [Pedobacter steynii]|uniref:GDP/UDP-N,N'-diacetylbacillosamine 2-epimerase (Hydrolysing) n=1 Tax=Pedobacter steynii TaxID=430522 RepID=A0A1G9WFB2_9SPHI|nr:UDP-N-acetylglucosamine 2-epimerase [Pedobacter steynii]NQX40282.1 UDP-N-acetylglucosamine 2-epimerase (hydrolyzing) [Pedobacter steynii]SDM83244.1 GDP/UDP-N,N'-diacetylbacillosamine 2-epimerase (hydrolysing) [Pedobacter steynii]
MRIGILTSSRADFGIYLPLIEKLKADHFFEVDIIAFGTHLSPFFGESAKEIRKNGFEIAYTIDSMLLNDTPDAIASAIGLTSIKFAEFWKNNGDKFDAIFCLGDRYEMFAAVVAGIPFQINFIHLHGGETTLGAIDNIFRHSITLASNCHFVSTEESAARVESLVGKKENIFNVGALSLDNISTLDLLTIQGFEEKWGIDLSKKTILTTFHPETVEFSRNEYFAAEIVKAIDFLEDYQVIITMPNADTAGNAIRQTFISHFSGSNRVFLIENLGQQSYFTALKHVSFLLGNTSSGVIEAASFGKFVINLGDRQKGRAAGENVIHVPVELNSILNAVSRIQTSEMFTGQNLYFNNGAADQIIQVLKQFSND